MFPYHLFSYQPNQQTRIYALYHRSECVYVRVMDYKHHVFLDNPFGVKFAMAMAVLELKIQNGLKPDANFRTVENYPSVMPFFRAEPLPPMVHNIGMMYLPSTLSWFQFLSRLYTAFNANSKKYTPNGKLHQTIHRIDYKSRGIEFLIRIDYFTFRRVDDILPIAERNSTLLEMIK